MIRTRRHATRNRITRPRGFTLVELLIAITVGVIITFALAALFATAGDTVQSARRVSEFNRVASLIERQMREDFSRISRDGVLVIRHEATNSGVDGSFEQLEPAALYPDEPISDRRHRRIDEIVFFSRGEFESARPPIADRNAQSGIARIYYGHGMRYDLDSVGLDEDQRLALRVPTQFDLGANEGVDLTDPDVILPLGVEPASDDEPAVNAYASDWMLLRQVTLLASESADVREPSSDFFGTTVNTEAERATAGDGEWQIGLQPAMPSVFRSLNFAFSEGAIVPEPTDLRSDNSALGTPEIERWFVSESGLLDIATSDLSEVRAYTSTMHDEFGVVPAGGTPIPTPLFPRVFDSWTDVVGNPPKAFQPALLNLDPIATFTPSLIGAELDYVEAMHAWMRQLLPADSHGDGAASNIVPNELEDFAGLRLRYEPSPPGLLDIVSPVASGIGIAPGFETAEAYNNQIMLSASNFAPRCTEFIVEYSFGQVNPDTGELIWYGSSEPIDIDGDGDAEVAVRPYPFGLPLDADDLDWGDRETYLFVDPSTGRRLGVQDPEPGATTALNPLGRAEASDLLPAHLVPPEIVSGTDFAGFEDGLPIVSYFGTIDPTYERLVEPETPGGTPAQVAQNERRARQLARQDQLEWPWPTLIRVTLSLADEAQPPIEQTYQFVFEVGGGS